jgi:hypothetical protein
MTLYLPRSEIILNKVLFPDFSFGKDFVRDKSPLIDSVVSDLGGLGAKNPVEVLPVAEDSANLPIPLEKGVEPVIVPGYSESAVSDSVLDRVLSDLISPLAKTSTPIPLMTYVGNIPVDR